MCKTRGELDAQMVCSRSAHLINDMKDAKLACAINSSSRNGKAKREKRGGKGGMGWTVNKRYGKTHVEFESRDKKQKGSKEN